LAGADPVAGMTLSIVASRAVKLNGFWMHGLGAPGTLSIMSG